MRAGKRTLLQLLKKLLAEKSKTIHLLKAPSAFKDLLKKISFAPKRTPARKAISIITRES
jgi:thymidylate kinase